MDIKDVVNRESLLKFVESMGYKTQNSRIPLDFYKKEINLVSYATSTLNYQVDTSKVGRNPENQKWFYLEKKGNRDVNEDPLHASSKILVGRRSENPASPNFKYNEHYYFSQELAFAGEKKNSGSVIDLVQMHYNTDYVNALRIIDSNLIKNNQLKENFNHFHVAQSQVNADSSVKRLENYHQITDFYDSSFLNKRGIDKVTINDPRFSNVIKNSVSPEGYVNTAFPITGTHGLIGFEVRNDGFKNIIDQKQDGFWRSQLDNSKPCEKIFVSESSIDTLSYVQLNQDKSNSLFLSTAGNISRRQIDLIQNLLDKGTAVKPVVTSELEPKYFDKVIFTKDMKDVNNKIVTNDKGENVTISYVGYNKPKSFVLGFDNDQAGKMLTVKILGNIKASEYFGKTVSKDTLMSNSEINVYSNKTTNTGRISWNFNDENAKSQIKAVVNHFNSLNEKGIGTLDEKAPFEITPNDKGVDVRFKNQNKQWEIVIDSVVALKFKNSKNLSIERPLLKDFNEDLKGRLGIDKVAQKKMEIIELSKKVTKSISVLNDSSNKNIKSMKI
jgi:hypoxanthine-guanine phosphoribosyltransferase